MKYIVGTDTGGTFTDCVVIDEKSNVTSGKALSTPPDFSKGVIHSVRNVSEKLGMDLREILSNTVLFYHATTVGSNTVLTMSGSKTGLITTKGHEDAISIMRGYGRIVGLSDAQVKHELATNKPEPLVPRSLRAGVTERIDYRGRVVVQLDLNDTKKKIDELISRGASSIAISLLWSFMNPDHERRIGALVKEAYPHVFVTLSSELIPIIGEYERTSTTVINGYVGPVMDAYLKSLVASLNDQGLRSTVLVMHSGGGMYTLSKSVVRSAHTVDSGPAAGVIASQYLAKMLDLENVICTDVGGTTFKVGLILHGRPQTAMEPSVAQYTLALPMVDVASIGAGGGSICHVDNNGIIHVGPKSAGADPGPVCYDKGGEEPTITDADLVLGYLNPDSFLGGTMKLNAEKCRRIVNEKLAEPLGIDVEDAAAAAYKIINNEMADLVRERTVMRGYDPRELPLIAYGGNGPMHVCEYGNELGVTSIIIPTLAPVYSAMGLLTSDILYTYDVSRHMIYPGDRDEINKLYAELESKAEEDLANAGIAASDRSLIREINMRFKLQAHEVSVHVPRKRLTSDDIRELKGAFLQEYERLYGTGTALREGIIEIERLQLFGTGKIAKPSPKRHEVQGTNPSGAFKGTRECHFGRKGWVDTSTYYGDKLAAGNSLGGPAIIEYPTTTVVVTPEWKASIDEYLNVRLARA